MYKEKIYPGMQAMEVEEVDTAVPSEKSEFESLYYRLHRSIMEARETNIHIKNQIATILGEDHLDPSYNVKDEPTGLLNRFWALIDDLEFTTHQSQENLNILRRLF